MMTDKELQKLTRKDLLQMLIDQSAELQTLQDRLSKAEAALQDRTIKIDKAGSIAEASLQLSGVFEAAQEACSQYMENISTLSRRQEEVCARMEEESRIKAKNILEEALCQKKAIMNDCANMVAKAKTDSQAYWDAVYNKLETFCLNRTELRQLLNKDKTI